LTSLRNSTASSSPPGSGEAERRCSTGSAGRTASPTRLTKPRSPTTTGKVERFHLSLRRELLDEHPPFWSVADAQAAIDGFRRDYNTDRPHQGIGMAFPADRFRPNTADSLP
jgi:transposase InsO family protein